MEDENNHLIQKVKKLEDNQAYLEEQSEKQEQEILNLEREVQELTQRLQQAEDQGSNK